MSMHYKSDNWLKHNVGYDKIIVTAAYLKYRKPCWNVDKTHDSDNSLLYMLVDRLLYVW